MIATVTLNPAVDKTCTLSRMLPGQVNRMESIKNIPGGKGVNVAKVLRRYGYQVKALGFLGGYTGQMIEDGVKDIGAISLFTRVAGETRYSINLLSGDGYVTELLEPGPRISARELARFREDFGRGIADCDLVILSGSAPEQVPETIYAELIREAAGQGKKTLLDSSGALLGKGLDAGPFMIKPNLKELEILTGRKIRGFDEALEGALQVREQGVAHVLVSMGEKGLLYVREGRILRARPPEIRALNTVGCGDSVVAAFAMGMMQRMDDEAVLRFCAGLSAAGATTLENGAVPTELALELMEKTEIEDLSGRLF